MTFSNRPARSLPPAPIQQASFAITPALLLRALRKHWLLLAIATAASLVAAFIYTSNQKRIYEAVGTVQFDPQPLTPLAGRVPTAAEMGPETYWSNLEYFATQHQILTSRKVAALVVKKLGLQRDAAFLTMAAPGAKLPPAEASVDAAAETLRSRVAVKAIQDSRLAVVKYKDGDPDRAQRVLNALVDTYVEQNLDTTLDSTTKTAEWLDTQMVKLKAELEAQEMDLHDFKKNQNLLSVSYDDQSNMLRAELEQLNDALTRLKTKRESVSAKLAVLQQINPDDPANIPQSEMLGGTVLAELRATYVEAKEARTKLLALGKGENHPDVQAASARIAGSKAALLTELQNIKNGVSADLASVNGEYGGIAKLYDSAKKQALELNLNELKYSRLRRSKNNTEKLFGLVLERSTESGLSKAMPFNNVRVLDRPLRPGAPVFPKTSANLAIGLAVGLLLGLLGAVGRELMDRTIRTAEDAEEQLGLPVMGTLPNLDQSNARKAYYYAYGRRKRQASESVTDLGAPELIVHEHPKSAVAEAARAIRTNLLFMSPDQPYRRLLVTSGGPSEGKTTLATSIAIAMAQAGQRVCLVDCDLRRPRIHQLFHGDNSRGVTTALINPKELDDLEESQVPNLYVLQAGPMPPNPADLMHSESFGRLLDDLNARFDRVVIDSPPVGLVTDGVVIATRVDATILVIRALRTRKEQAARALRSLRDVGANCPGFVLNAAVATQRYDYSRYYVPYGNAAKAAPENA